MFETPSRARAKSRVRQNRPGEGAIKMRVFAAGATS